MSTFVIIDETSLLNLEKSTADQPVIDADILSQLQALDIQKIVLSVNHGVNKVKPTDYSLSTLKLLLEQQVACNVTIMLPADLIQNSSPGQYYQYVALAESEMQGKKLTIRQKREIEKASQLETIWHITRTYSSMEILSYAIKTLSFEPTDRIFVFTSQKIISNLSERWPSHLAIELKICHQHTPTENLLQPLSPMSEREHIQLFQLAIHHQLYEDAVILLEKGLNQEPLKSSSAEILNKLLHSFILSLHDVKNSKILSSINTLIIFLLELDPKFTHETGSFFRGIFIGSLAYSPRRNLHFFKDCYPTWIDQGGIPAYLESQQGKLEIANLKLAVVKSQFRQHYPSDNPRYQDINLDDLLGSLTHPIEDSWYLALPKLEHYHPTTTAGLRNSLAALCELSYVPYLPAIASTASTCT